MDVLNLWKDDPEEILLELGFGCDEPDLSARIPARFINYRSKARGINLQVFLDAQKNRIDLENPDVSNRFRQVEVLQQVTTTLRGLVVSSTPSSLRGPSDKMLSPEARERRRRMASLFRRASKKSLNQNHAYKTQDVTSPAPVTPDSVRPGLLHRAASVPDEDVVVQRVETGQQEVRCPSPVIDEGEKDLKFTIQPQLDQKQQLRPGHQGMEGSPVKASAVVRRTRLEDCASPDTEKTLIGYNQRSAMSDSSPSGHHPFTTLDRLPVDDSSSNLDKPTSQVEISPDKFQPAESESPTEYVFLRSSSPELWDNSESQLLPSSSPTEFISQSSPSSLTPSASLALEPKKSSQSEAVEASLSHISNSTNDSHGLKCPAFSNDSPPSLSTPSLDSPFVPSPVESSTPSDSSIRSPANTESKTAMVVLPENSFTLPGTLSTPISTPIHAPPPAISSHLSESLIQSSENQLKDPLLSDPRDISESSKCNNDCEGLYFCSKATQFAHSNSSFAQDSSMSDGVFPTRTIVSHEDVDLNKTNSPTHQPNTCTHSSPASPVLSSHSADTVLSGGSDLMKPPTNPPIQQDNETPSIPHCPSLGSSSLEDNGSTPSCLSYGKVLELGLTDIPTNSNLELDKNVSLVPTTPKHEASNFSRDCPHLSNESVNSLESSVMKKTTNPYFQLDKDSPSATSNPGLDSFTMNDTCSTTFCVSNEPHKSDLSKPMKPSLHLDKDKPLALRDSTLGSSTYEDEDSAVFQETLGSVGPPDVTPQSNLEPLREGAEVNNSDQEEESRSNKDQSCLLRDNLDPTPSFVIGVNNEQVDWLIIEPVKTGEGNGEAVCFSDTDQSSSVCKTTEIDTLIISSCIHDEVSAETDQRQSEEINDTSSQSREVNELPMMCGVTDVAPTDLIEMESLDVVFDTSVDGFESENGDMDEFFQQLDNEGRVYWAEPILVSDSSYTFKEAESFGESPRDSLLSRSSVSSDSFLSLALPSTNPTTIDPRFFVDTSSTAVTDLVPSQSVIPDSKRSSRSVSVQMSSSLSSHIVLRKDIPYVTDSKPTPLPSGFSLDTSSPLRAVQSWTDLQIQRRNKKLPDRALTFPHEADVPEGTSGKAHRSMMVYSSSPSFPLLPNHGQLQDCLPGIARNYRTVSVSVDTGLGPDKEEEMYRRGNGKSHLWEGNRSVSVACCCSCDRQSHYCADGGYRKQHMLENSPYSLSDLEEMMLWLQQYCSVHSNMEEELSENRASVYSSLSDLDREKIEDLEALRQAVKQEAVELEAQLKQLAHHSDESLKMKMRRLLDEQSLLCTQLRVYKPAALDASSSKSTRSRTVATQCSLLPTAASADMQSY